MEMLQTVRCASYTNPGLATHTPENSVANFWTQRERVMRGIVPAPENILAPFWSRLLIQRTAVILLLMLQWVVESVTKERC